ncbi:hypothetical protein FUA23_14470 [Neolewinella aurantiaca]|uniref:Long-subunit fatty acid transport protein n=1 Tax=Neolewinella aurantiaca TaxID=2602767 RepID=A0A5C7FCT6_9BACT|nr:hypothetical protein [Neolewinella aurantiaca]TXF88487.1 hypothetical protein FUA23_14470 [Neolewinella aurantiaca]
MFNTNRKSSLLPLLLLLLCGGFSNVAQSQVSNASDIRPKLNSPLSRFGLGNPVDQFYAAQAGMGGLMSTYQDAFHLNIQNPATLASLQSTSFEVGGYGRSANLSDRNSSVNTWQGNLRYISLGFPLRNPISLNLARQQNIWNGGMAFSLIPTSDVGYDLQIDDDDPDFGETSNTLKGTGGTYRFSWSTALRYKYLSGGLNVNYNFGKITNSRVVTFNDIEEALASEFVEDVAIKGFSLGYGLQYAYNFKDLDKNGEMRPNGKRIIIGVNGSIGNEIRTDASLLFRRFSPTGQLAVQDTLNSATSQEGTLKLPTSYTVGLAYEKINKIYVGVEYGSTSNSEYLNTSSPETLLDANRFAFGIQYIPNANSYNKFTQRIRYRAGLRLEEDGRSVDGVQARRNAATIGLGLPFRLPRQQISFVDLALEIGKFGVPDILDENYIQFTLGFSLNDNSWFFKRKLN